MINITEKSECCGCNACVQRCPKQCISMKEDEQGFLYPIVDTTTCIDCGLCEKVCHILNPGEEKEPIQVLAAKNKNEDQRLKSSSGGTFILLAEHIIRQGGVVFGARFDTNWEVEHCYAETIEELEPLMRSKYVQSKIGNTYKQVEEFLKNGRKVMFVGTSCQIAGMKRFLRKEYDNLLAVDFICHGVPSPGIWRKYLEEIKSSRSEAAGKNSVLSVSLKSVPVITGINFREKQLGGYGWKKFGFVVQTKSPSKGDKNTVLLSSIMNENVFMKGFLANLYLRPSCYKCYAKNGAAHSDITIADFWGVQRYYPEFDDDKGVSAVFVHTSKGKGIIKELSSRLEILDSNLNEATAPNPSYFRSCKVPEKYSLFWDMYERTNSVHKAVYIATKLTVLEVVMGFIRRFINKFRRLLYSVSR